MTSIRMQFTATDTGDDDFDDGIIRCLNFRHWSRLNANVVRPVEDDSVHFCDRSRFSVHLLRFVPRLS